MNVTSIGAVGMAAATDRFAASAERAVRGRGELGAEVVEQVSAEQAFGASAAVVRTGDEMFKRLLDIKVRAAAGARCGERAVLGASAAEHGGPGADGRSDPDDVGLEFAAPSRRGFERCRRVPPNWPGGQPRKPASPPRSPPFL